MAQSTLDIIIRQKKSGSGAKDSSKDLTDTQKRIEGLKKAAVGAGLAMAGAFAAVSIKSIQLAGDVEEMESKFNAVFKETAPDARRELEDFATTVNRSRFELMDMASSLQDTFVPLGFARDEAAKLSVNLTKLAVDVASFNNASEPDVMRDFQSAIVGNTETVRKYGIVITQATLDAELLNMGIEGGVRSASEAEKAYARLNIIMGGTSDAHGDAARTADSFVNQMKALNAAVEEAQVAWGQVLIPVVSKAIPVLTTAANTLKLLITWNKQVDQAIGEQEQTVLDTTSTYSEYVDAMLQANVAAGNLHERNLDLARGFFTAGEDAGWFNEKFEDLNIMSESYFDVVQGNVDATDGWAASLKQAADVSPVFTEFVGNGIEVLEEFANAAGIAADEVDLSLAGSIERFMNQLAFMTSGGAEIQAAFENLKLGVEKGFISEEEGARFAEGLFVAAQDLEVELGNITADEAAENIENTLGVSLEEAKSTLDKIDTTFTNLNRTIEAEIVFNVGGAGAQFLLGGGFQTGGSFQVGGRPGADQNLVAFRASRGEQVTVTPAAGTPPSQVTENLNLTINSQAQTEDVEESFELMKALRGGAF
jgi:hypothetical protein